MPIHGRSAVRHTILRNSLTVEPDFWHQRWQDNLTGFHQSEVNPCLEKYWPQLQLAQDEQVFVPLCGKSLDMLWLRERCEVLGVELSPVAVEAFFAENSLQHERSAQGAFQVCTAQRLRLLCGDFFDLQPDQLQQVRAVYDRASLIALPAAMRPRFAEHLTQLLPAGVRVLLVTLDYAQAQMDGPPFAVSAQEVQDLFAANWSIEQLHETDILAREPRFRERGLSFMTENCYLLIKQ